MIMDTKIKKLRDFLIDYQLKISTGLDPVLLTDLEKFAKYYSITEKLNFDYDQKTIDYLDDQLYHSVKFRELLGLLSEYSWSDSLILIGELEEDISGHCLHLDHHIDQVLGKITHDSEIYLSKNLLSELNVKILTYMFNLKNSELNKKVRIAIEKIKVELLSSEKQRANGFNFETYGLRLRKFSKNLSELLGHNNASINDPEKLAKILKIRIILTEQDDTIIYNDNMLLNSESFPEFQGLNRKILETNQTTLRLETKPSKKNKMYRKIIGDMGACYYIIKYDDIWVLMGKYSDEISDHVLTTFEEINQKIIGYNKIFNEEFVRLNSLKNEEENENILEKDNRHMGKIIKIFEDLLAAEKAKMTFDRFKKIVEKNMIKAIRDSINSDLSPTEISLTLKYTFGNLINDIISYLVDYWPDTQKIEQSGQYDEKEYARYILPKISEAFRKSLEKIFNKSNNYSEILAIKESIYVKDLQK